VPPDDLATRCAVVRVDDGNVLSGATPHGIETTVPGVEVVAIYPAVEHVPTGATGEPVVPVAAEQTVISFAAEAAINAARDISSRESNRALAVLQAPGWSHGSPPRFIIAPAMVVAAGGLHHGDLDRRVRDWRGDMEPFPRPHDDIEGAIHAPLGVGVLDAKDGAGTLAIAALVTGARVLDRARGMAWSDDTHFTQDTTWKELGDASG
jgi:hypothetical protein